MKPKKVYQMWALFNYNRPPIFVEQTQHECVTKGMDWLGEHGFARAKREGSVTIEKVTVRRVDSGTKK